MLECGGKTCTRDPTAVSHKSPPCDLQSKITLFTLSHQEGHFLSSTAVCKEDLPRSWELPLYMACAVKGVQHTAAEGYSLSLLGHLAFVMCSGSRQLMLTGNYFLCLPEAIL